MKALLKIDGFLSYIMVVFLNAFTDLGHKIIIQNSVFKVYDGNEQIILTAIVNGLILLPFIVFFSPSGFISDRFKKHRVMQLSAIAAVVITLCITFSYYMGYFWLSFAFTFLLAIQSAIYSPAKFGYIKELVEPENITPANAAVQSITIIAILLGMFLYSIGFESLLDINTKNETSEILKQIAPLGWFLVIGSLIELKLAYRLPDKSKELNKHKFDLKSYMKGGYLKKNMRLVSTNKTIWLSIIGLSIFLSLSQVVLATFPSYIKEHLSITNAAVVQGLMALSGVGIIIGSIIASKVSRHYIEIGMVPFGAFGIFLSIFTIPYWDSLFTTGLNFLAFGIFGGLFIIPLNSLIQFNAAEKRLGLVIAGNNFVQNIFMITFLVVTVFITFFKIGSVQIFYILSLIAFFSAFYTVFKLPQSLIKFIITFIFSLKYKLHVQGLDDLPQTKGVLLLGNHISWLDWAFVQLASPRPIRFVMERSIYEKKLIKPFFDFFNVIPISSRGGRRSLEEISKYLTNGEVVCIFPEGAISRNGHLGEFKKGFELAASKASAVIVPFYIGGLWGTKFSRSNINFAEIKQTKFKRDVIVSFGKAQDIHSNASSVKQSVFELSVDSWNKYIKEFKSLDDIFIDTVLQKSSQIAMADSSGEQYSYNKTFVMSLMFRDIIKQNEEQNIGLLLPTTTIGAILNMSCFLASKTVVNINYTSSKDALNSCVEQAQIKNIYTSKKFISKLKAKGIDIEDILLAKANLIYLEDLKDTISKSLFISRILFVKFAPSFLVKLCYGTKNKLGTPAAILFSSGSESAPKGVVLSHKNILANVKQTIEMLNITNEEVFLGSLPIFHAFGLTVTTILPMVEGIKLICHPDPTDAYGIGQAVAKHNVTFMCATSTFLRLYLKNKKLKPIMFETLNMVFAGAEKLSKEVADEFRIKFATKIYEGYGSTECSPVISANIPNAIDTVYWQVQEGNRFGTIGMPLPGCAVKIVDPVTLEELDVNEDGLIVVSGPNVMKRYLNNTAKTAEVIFRLNGKRWYKTGDKGHLDEDGFITIVDRYSRFAKVAGEMISLTAVENKIYEYFRLHNQDEDIKLVCVNLPDEKKGEKIVLLIDKNIEQIKEKLIGFGLHQLWIPSVIKVVPSIPLLGSGKIDFSKSKLVAQEL